MIFNIVDRRKRPYRWKNVNAVIEPTWHDNERVEGDHALVADTWIGYAEKEHVTVQEAVAWAMANDDFVTLFLYNEDDGIYAKKESTRSGKYRRVRRVKRKRK